MESRETRDEKISEEDVVQSLTFKHHWGFDEILREIRSVVCSASKIVRRQLFDVHDVVCRVHDISGSYK